MKVYVFPEGDPEDRYNFVASIRLLDPLRSLAKRYDLSFLCHRRDSESELFDADLAIVQRACFQTWQALDRGLGLIAKARRSGTRIVYEMDDHIFCPNLPELISDSEVDQLDEQSYKLTQAHSKILALADYLTCPTQPLAAALRELGCSAKVCVIPTALDFDLARWNSCLFSSQGITKSLNIGWSGGSRVGRDLEIMVHDLVKIVRQYPNVTVVIAGSMKYSRLFSEIPAKQLRLLEWVEYNRYPALLSMFDLALIPMQDHAYNRCKSSLKVIDYGAVGVPSICSPVAPFNDFPKIASTPVFARDGEWYTRIEEFLHVKAAGEACSEQLARSTRQEYGLHENLMNYWAAFNEMIGVPLEESLPHEPF
jgi:glycosyltransferase involved in cell wall biosynthesis